jgi:isopenicillin-N epimerase
MEDVDFYGGNLHKWIMAPKGTAFGWIPKRNRSLIKPIEAGWTTFETPAAYHPFGEGDRFTAMMLMNGTFDCSPYFGIQDAVDFWNKHSFEAISARRQELQKHLIEAMSKKLDWQMLTPANPQLRGPLTSYVLPPELEKMGFGLMSLLLEKHRLQVVTPQVLGQFCLRLTPHIYNTESEIDRAVEILCKL